MTTATVKIEKCNGWPYPRANQIFDAKEPTWLQITEEVYMQQLEVLPPCQIHGLPFPSCFFISEALTGTVHAMYVMVGPRFFMRYLPREEMKQAGIDLKEYVKAAVLAGHGHDLTVEGSES